MRVSGVKSMAIVAVAVLGMMKTGGAGLEARQSASQTSWADQDIGGPAVAGSATSTSSGFMITAGGADIWGASDQFHFVYQQVTGDLDVRARVDSVSYASSWSKAGVMIRGSLAANAAHGFVLASAGKGTAFQRRQQAGGLSTNTAGSAAVPPQWTRLVRKGSTLSAYTSADGVSWSLIGSDTIDLPATVYVGLAVTSHNAAGATTASVSQISIQTSGLPAGQRDADIGSPAIAGRASYASGTYQIHASGADIWGTSDQFHYVFQPVTGDVDIAVRIASITAADRWSKAGVMIRESTSAGSAHAFALVSADRGYAFQRRPVGGGVSVSTSGSTSMPPGWLRLTRSGSLITAYQSTDGRSWTAIGADNIPMASTVLVGIAVTSHTTTAATDVVADSLTVTQSAGNKPPTVSIASPAGGATFTAPASITIGAAASDPEGQLSRVEFYSGATLLGSDATAPYSFSWSSVPAGTYVLTAVAYDAAGASTRSASVTVTVGASSSPPPTGVIFTASADHATVTSYRIDVFGSAADVYTATAVSTFNAGKPTPDLNGDITVSAPTFFSALAAGTYQLTVTAISPAGSGRSTPLTFTR